MGTPGRITMQFPSGRHAASIVSYAALTLILTAGAAQSLSGSNTVYSDDIVDGQVKGPDIKAGAVSGSKILDNSVTTTDINAGALVYETDGDQVTLPDDNSTVQAGDTCNAGDFAISAEYESSAGVFVHTSERDGADPATWFVEANNPTGAEKTLTMWVLCLDR